MDGVVVDGTGLFPPLNCSAFGYDQPFSGLNCYFQVILDEVIKRMYCGIQFGLVDTLAVMIQLYIIIFGLMFMLGLVALTASEVVTRLIKIALIWVFATNATYGVGLAFQFFILGIEEVITWILTALLGPAADGVGFIQHIDFLIFNQLTVGFTEQGLFIIGFFAMLAVFMFPVFLLFLVYALTLTAVLMRTVITYLIGLSAIAFLISLTPIFVSLALFRPTYTYFDSWLRYIISFSLQIILVFAVVTMWLVILENSTLFFFELASMVVPYEDKTVSQATFAIFQSSWGICYDGAIAPANAADDWECRTSGNFSLYCSEHNDEDGCTDGQVAPAAAYSNNGQFITWVAKHLIALGVLVSAFDAMLKLMPNLARQLSGPAFAPQLGGGAGIGAVGMPGVSMIDQYKNRALFAAKSSALSGFSSIRARLQSTLGGGRNPIQDFKDNSGDLSGGRGDANN